MGAASPISALLEHGYAVVRGLFSDVEVSEIGAEIDRIAAAARQHRRSFRRGNEMLLIRDDARLGRVVRYAQWPSYSSPVLARYRVDRRWLDLLRPLLGADLKQITNQIIWKAPGAASGTYAFHQDARFRRPATAFRDLGSSFVQTGLAIDPHRPENGCLRVVPGSHRRGPLPLPVDRGVLDEVFDEAHLASVGLDPARLVDLVLSPGDVALWGPYLVHGSGPNLSAGDRRTYVNGYIAAASCDRGEWAFRDGEPCALAEPALVQYEGLESHPEPHEFDGDPHPYRE